MKILVIAAHPDDEVLGVGGTIRKLVNQGHEAYCLILGEGFMSRKKTFYNDVDGLSMEVQELQSDTKKAADIIGFKKVIFENLPDNQFDKMSMLQITQLVEANIKLINPDIIYTHHRGDLNIDHRRTYEAVITACRPGCNDVKEIYCFEILSSTEWACPPKFAPNYFEDIRSTIGDKIRACECYKSEIREFPHPRSLVGIEMLAMSRGVQSNLMRAEAFEVVRSIK